MNFFETNSKSNNINSHFCHASYSFEFFFSVFFLYVLFYFMYKIRVRFCLVWFRIFIFRFFIIDDPPLFSVKVLLGALKNCLFSGVIGGRSMSTNNEQSQNSTAPNNFF